MNASPFWIMLLLSSGADERGMIDEVGGKPYSDDLRERVVAALPTKAYAPGIILDQHFSRTAHGADQSAREIDRVELPIR
jgi:hypothetical protein